MITIIFAPPRTGKTDLMSHLANEQAYNRERIVKMQNEIKAKNANGFKLTISQHCVSANYNLTFRKFGYSKRVNRLINPFRLGFANNFVKTHFNLPYELICITEAQLYLNSRMSAYFPPWQSRWYEQHGHNHIDIYLDTQRPMLIDVNIRELASFIEIIKLDLKYDKDNKIKKHIWTVRKIENSQLFDRYMASGKKDSSCFTEEKIVADYNVFECYDSYSCKPKFYDGHFEEDFDLLYSSATDDTKQAYKETLQQLNDEIPENYYIKRSTINGIQKERTN